MKTQTIKGYKVGICMDILEWGREFYRIPDDTKREDIVAIDYLESECMGFAEPDGKEIWVFVPKNYDITDLSSTIAHEVGHCMGTPSKSPEKKANHYEEFYITVSEIVVAVAKSTPPLKATEEDYLEREN